MPPADSQRKQTWGGLEVNDMAVSVAAQLIACGGRARFVKLRDLARHHRLPNRTVKAAVETLKHERLVRIDGDAVVALNLPELAAYVADELDPLPAKDGSCGKADGDSHG